jgi:hypothetical protein
MEIINSVAVGDLDEAIEVDDDVVEVDEVVAKKALIEHDCDKDWKTCECGLKYCHCDALSN